MEVTCELDRGWYINHRRLQPIGDKPPAEKEFAYYRQATESVTEA